VPLSEVRPLSDEDIADFWNILVEQLLASLKAEGELPKFVKNHSVVRGDDSLGEPAFYVKIFVDAPKGPASDATVSRWNSFSNILLDRLLGLRLQRYPYVRVGEKRKRQINGLARRSA
jgi:hypothetical protein